MVIGLTGVFGSGKSTVLEMFRRRGVRVVSADELIHRLLGREGVKKKVRDLFGPGVFTAAGRVDRKALGRVVFTEPAARQRLEALLHPLVNGMIKRSAGKLARGEILVAEVPLLYESGFTAVYDRVVCVSASEEKILGRLRRGGFSDREIKRRLACQWPLKKKEERSDRVIRNDGDPAETEKQVALFLAELDGQGTKKEAE